MNTLYDFNAPKKATNLSLNSDLLKKAKLLKINLSATLEETLKIKLADLENKKWAKENKNARTIRIRVTIKAHAIFNVSLPPIIIKADSHHRSTLAYNV